MCDENGWESYTTIDEVTYMRTPWEHMIDPARLPDDMRVCHEHASHVSTPVTGFVVFGEDAVHQLVDTFGQKYAGVLAFPIGRSETSQTYVTITAAGCDKGSALRIVCDDLGIGLDKTMAVGDAQPDVDMFRICAVGVAMGNASQDVKEQATAVAPSNAEGGVAWAVRRYVLESTT
jgi:hydroxymethylpyrimidine pyrophosphatase-like HAD family hydrolase